MILKKYIKLCSIIAVYVLINPPCAFAYLNPGTGSMIIQTVIALIGSGGYALYLFREKIKKFLCNLIKNNKHD